MRIDPPSENLAQANPEPPDQVRLVRDELAALQHELANIQHQAERQAGSGPDQLCRLVNASPVAMLLTEIESGRVLAANDYVLDLLGYERNEIVDAVAPDLYYHAAERRDVVQAIREKGAIHGYEMLSRRRDGSAVPIILSSCRVMVGDVPSLITGFNDVSELKAAQDTIRQHQEELARVTRMNTLGEMATGLSHELNQPLAAIANYASAGRHYLEDADSKEKVLRVLDAIVSQAERAGGIITRMRDMVAKTPVEFVPADLNRLVESVLELAHFDIRRGDVRIHTRLADDLPLVHVDQIQIEQILLNLVRNAIEAMAACPQPTRSITLQTRVCSSGEVAVEVCDNGPPATEEQLAGVFEPFVTTKPDGLGMGLAISHGIAQAHDGRLEVKPNQEHGVTFTLSLPALQP